jgi:4-hydroxy-3-methylbut-2-enyl diphosphate reductase IspH
MTTVEMAAYIDVVDEVQARAKKIIAIAELLGDFPDVCSATSNAGWAMRDLAEEIHDMVEPEKLHAKVAA